MGIFAIVTLVIFALAYIPMGQSVANAFCEAGNTLYIMAWPVVIVWLLSVVFEDIPGTIREAFANMNTPYIEED